MKPITKSLSLKPHCLLLNITDNVCEVLLILVLIENIHSYNVNKTLILGKIVAGREGGNRGWDGWMAPSTQWTWIWANSGRWWRTGKPGMLQFMGSQRVRLDLVTGLSKNNLNNFWRMKKNMYIWGTWGEDFKPPVSHQVVLILQFQCPNPAPCWPSTCWLLPCHP